jgi:NAD(P)-dependent dehydrogenase (short-subunit alcohol dehydrogenase family)
MGASFSAEPQTGRNVIVTGANSGIGYYTALELGKLGANVTVVSRDAARGAAALAELKATAPEANFTLELCDLSSLQSVRDFAARWKAKNLPLDTLINNAGVMMIPKRELSADGFEMQWATNHLGHFALTGLLLDSLKQSKSPRVVNVSSTMAWTGRLKSSKPFDFVQDALYSPAGVYGDTKQANQLFSLELSKRYPQILALSAHPGGSSTNLQKYAFSSGKFMFQSAANGALPSIRAAIEASPKPDSYYGPRLSIWGAAVHAIHPPWCKDGTLAKQLWDASTVATKVNW